MPTVPNPGKQDDDESSEEDLDDNMIMTFMTQTVMTVTDI
jgi:hypothetical protein